MSSWDKLNKLSRKKDHSKEIFEINKRLKSITRVIQNPDEFNVNISSRDALEVSKDKLVELEERIDKLEQSFQELIELTSLKVMITKSNENEDK